MKINNEPRIHIRWRSISWRSILQSTIALSTTEVEYMTATEVVKEAIWLKGLLGDLGEI